MRLLPPLLLITAHIIYVYAVFVRDGIQDVVLVNKVEGRELDSRVLLQYEED